MTDNETYNGWTNRETWALMLWINNDRNLYEIARELACHDTDPRGVLCEWAETLLDANLYGAEYGNRQSDSLAQMASEVGSRWRVNWRECVESLLED